METKKIALACFIGGVICSAIALLFSPTLWWFGMIAGFVGGYISYEFREVCKAVPIALRWAGKELGAEFQELFQEIVGFFAKDHPFGYLAIGINLSIVIWGYGFTTSGRHALGWVFASASHFFTLLIFGGALFWFASAFVLLILMAVAQEGSMAENCAWTTDPEKVREKGENGWRREMLSYSNAYPWLLKGAIEIATFFSWRIWKYMAIGIYLGVKFVCRFAWFLFKLIHSEKRLLCAVDGTIGGAISYFWLASTATSTSGHIVLVLFGGLLGAGLGILNWEIVSKRILHVGTQEA